MQSGITDLFESLKTAMRSASHRTISTPATSTPLTPPLTNAMSREKTITTAAAATSKTQTKKSSAEFPQKIFLCFSELFLGILQRVKAVILPVQRQQFLMRSRLDNLAVREQQNAVGVPNGRESVRNDQHCADVHHLFKRILNQQLGLGVDIRSSLV